MQLKVATLVVCGALLAACHNGADGAAGMQGAAAPVAAAAPAATAAAPVAAAVPTVAAMPEDTSSAAVTPVTTASAEPTELTAFALSALNDPESLQSREVNGVEFVFTEDPDEFDAQF